MIDLIQKLKNSTFFKNVFQISSGSLMGQIVVFFTLPIITRIYGDAVIGEWAFFTTISYIINSFSDFGLINAIMMEKDDESTKQTYKVISSCILLISFCTSVLFYFYYNFITHDSLNLNPLFTAIYLFLSIFTLQQIQVCYTWLNRKSQYKILMKNPIINNITYNTLAIILGLLGAKQYGYFISWIIGQIVTLLVMKAYLPKGVFTFKPKEYKDVFKRNKYFIIYQLPTNVLNQLKNNIPSLLIKPLFGINILGQYSAAMRLIGMPVNLLGNSIGKVFFQSSSEMARHDKHIGEFAYKNADLSMKLASIPVIIIMTFGDILFKWYLGTDWCIAGNMARILSIQAFFLFLTNCLEGISITINKQKYTVFYCILQIIAIINSLVLGAYLSNNIYIGFIILAVSFVIINMIYFSLLFRAMKIPPYKYILHSLLYILTIFVCYFIIRIIMINLNLVCSL